jgi:hypothetical protein
LVFQEKKAGLLTVALLKENYSVRLADLKKTPIFAVPNSK